MKILLLTHNHVVKEFVEHAAKTVSADLDVFEHSADVLDLDYDYIFVDDRKNLLHEGISLLDKLEAKSIVLYNNKNDEHKYFDVTIKKPFLPLDIENIIKEDDSKILDIDEIGKIKTLLEQDGLEIISEENVPDEREEDNTGSDDETIYEIIGDNHNSISLIGKNMSAKRNKKLLRAITKIKINKIHKLLKGADITIKIRFPKESK